MNKAIFHKKQLTRLGRITLKKLLNYLDRQIKNFELVKSSQTERIEYGLLYYIPILKLIHKNTNYVLDVNNWYNKFFGKKNIWFAIFPSRFILENTLKLNWFSGLTYKKRNWTYYMMHAKSDLNLKNNELLKTIDFARSEGVIIDLNEVKENKRVFPNIRELCSNKNELTRGMYVIYQHLSEILHGNPRYAYATKNNIQVYNWSLFITIKLIYALIIGNNKYIKQIKTSALINNIDCVKKMSLEVDKIQKIIQNQKIRSSN